MTKINITAETAASDLFALSREDFIGQRLTMVQMIALVKRHAETYRDNGRGWDIVLDTFSDEDFAEEIGNRTSQAGAILAVYQSVQLLVKGKRAERDAKRAAEKAAAKAEREAAKAAATEMKLAA